MVRLLERLPRGTRYSEVADRLEQILKGLERRSQFSVCTYINATDAGLPAVGLIQELVPRGGVQPVLFREGQAEPTELEGRIILDRAWLVSRLQVLLQEGRLHFPENHRSAHTLADELLEYEHRSRRQADEAYPAFKVGTQDDLVNALGMAVHLTPARPWTEEEHRALQRGLDSLPSAHRELEAAYQVVLGPNADLTLSEIYDRFDAAGRYW